MAMAISNVIIWESTVYNKTDKYKGMSQTWCLEKPDKSNYVPKIRLHIAWFYFFK